MVLWATECAEHVLPYVEENYHSDNRPRKALEVGRAWVRGEVAVSEVSAAALAAHAAACDAGGGAARAAATAHVGIHAVHAGNYAVTASTDAADPTDSAAATAKERDLQYRCLPKHLRPVAFPARGGD